MNLGIDLGTGSVKVVLWHEGALLREASAAYRVHSPHEGWAESDPRDWWTAVVQVTREVVGEDAADVRALGLSGQMHGVVLSDGQGVALRPAILWPDTRSAGELGAYQSLESGLLAPLRNPLTSGMAGPVLLWLRRHEEACYASARWALQPKDWLRLKLSGEAYAEPSDASGTLLYDLVRDGWHGELAAALGLRGDLLAPLIPSCAPVGTLGAQAARELGLPTTVIVAAGAADTAAALLGTGPASGQIQLTVGTGAQLVVRQDSLPEARAALHVFRDAQGGSYTLGAVQNAGTALEWARRALRCSWSELYDLAQQAPPGAAGLVFLPYLTGDRTPHLNPNARGGWLGAGLNHDASHLARAAFEGVALSIAEAAALLPETASPALRLAGGGTLHPWWRQLLADTLRRPLEIVEVPSASAVGAALLAETALTGQWPAIPPREITLIETLGEQAVPERTRARYREAYGALQGWFAHSTSDHG